MRTIVDLPEDHVKALDSIGERHDLSRTELVRRAVAAYLENEQKAAKSKLDQYFGILKGSHLFEGMDGLAWQKKMRAEWDDRDAAIDRRLAEYRGLNEGEQAPYQSGPDPDLLKPTNRPKK
jgi:hypothetical protein